MPEHSAAWSRFDPSIQCHDTARPHGATLPGDVSRTSPQTVAPSLAWCVMVFVHLNGHNVSCKRGWTHCLCFMTLSSDSISFTCTCQIYKWQIAMSLPSSVAQKQAVRLCWCWGHGRLHVCWTQPLGSCKIKGLHMPRFWTSQEMEILEECTH